MEELATLLSVLYDSAFIVTAVNDIQGLVTAGLQYLTNILFMYFFGC